MQIPLTSTLKGKGICLIAITIPKTKGITKSISTEDTVSIIQHNPVLQTIYCCVLTVVTVVCLTLFDTALIVINLILPCIALSVDFIYVLMIAITLTLHSRLCSLTAM